MPIPPALFRQFAIITLIITALLAMFATGESRDAIEDVVKEREAKSRLLHVEREKNGGLAKSIAVRKPDEMQGSWGSAAGVSGSSSNVSSSGVMPPHMQGVPQGTGAGPMGPGPEEQMAEPGSPEFYAEANMTPDQIALNRERRRRNGNAQPRSMTPKQIEAMLEASRKRSGGS